MTYIKTSGLWASDSNNKLKIHGTLPGIDMTVSNAIVLAEELIHPPD